ncbi:MAG TPA: corrinoid protein [Candidatus Sumerlaeota bacterium]|nr:MAG: Methionine synthase [candidate division BRC1 bacterium ADurb.Bin183]HOE62677.1 corrinoid protein [Candidatus Sumerlaeota bacterium]HRR29983.1 corrinoid protein [Candidatus Sumerlaeia bacterium]HON49437.1 corrinoid protein [Candidatus Sumerlaeota bacterium]HOR64813.1 corrinoid protein [Candidatus Sumerlaeota bacterium]
MSELLAAIMDNVICGNSDLNSPIKKGQPGVAEFVQQALEMGLSPQDILNEGLIKGMDVIGKRFKANEIYVPEVLIAARAMKAGMALIKKPLADTGVKPLGTFIIGTVKGDLHDIGKNLVAMMMEGAGFKIVDLAIDVSADKFMAAMKENRNALVGMSALLTNTMIGMEANIKAFREAGLDNPVIIGGAPVDEGYAKKINATGYAKDAATAVEVAKQILGIS